MINDPCDDRPIVVTPRYIRDPGKSMFPQAVRCFHGQHRWTTWGNYVPARMPLLSGSWRFEESPTAPTVIEAYRWRYCECGAVERESYSDHTIKHYAKDER